MTRFTTLVFALAAALVVGANPASAQARSGGSFIGLGGGITLPSGDFGDIAETGWNALAQLGTESRSGLGLRAEVFYGRNGVDLGEGKFKFVGGLGSLSFAIKLPGSIRPYLIASVGMMNTRFDVFDGDTKVVIGGGAGMNYRIGRSSNFFVEGRYLSISDDPTSLTLIPVQAGVRFGL